MGHRGAFHDRVVLPPPRPCRLWTAHVLGRQARRGPRGRAASPSDADPSASGRTRRGRQSRPRRCERRRRWQCGRCGGRRGGGREPLRSRERGHAPYAEAPVRAKREVRVQSLRDVWMLLREMLRGETRRCRAVQGDAWTFLRVTACTGFVISDEHAA